MDVTRVRGADDDGGGTTCAFAHVPSLPLSLLLPSLLPLMPGLERLPSGIQDIVVPGMDGSGSDGGEDVVSGEEGSDGGEDVDMRGMRSEGTFGLVKTWRLDR